MTDPGDLLAELQQELRLRTEECRRLAAERDAQIAERERLAAGEQALSADRDAALAALAESHRSVEEIRRSLAAAHRHRAANQESLVRAFSALADARSEIHKIRHSRLWRLAKSYWRLREVLHIGRRAPAPAVTEDADAVPSSDRAVGPAGETPPAAVAGGSSLHDIVCFPIIEWDFRFQRPQQLLSRFAAAGHRVFYVSQRFRQKGSPWEVVEKAENVFEVTLFGPGLNVYRSSPGAAAVDLLFFSLDALRRDLCLGATAVIVQLPFWWPVARRARTEFAWPVVYDCMDLHTGFSTNSPGMVEIEDELLAQADLVTASSLLLEARASKRNRSVKLIRNACEFDHFAGAPATGQRDRPVAGYYGAISEWFDTELVAEVARRCPDLDFVLVGSTYGADIRELSRLSNVRFIGERPYAEIPGWVGSFDVTLIPFRRTSLTEATNPVKAYEIFAAGKPLVSVPLPELHSFESLVRFASEPEGFEREIRAALAEGPGEAERRREFARGNTWEQRHRVLSAAIASVFPRVSVIVVTFNNRELNRACLDSLRDRTEWPNLQVIVVDNGSTDGSADDLRERERAREIVAILNDSNRGFAAANNQGLARADGAFLVLLNNDTVVTRGCLAALVLHLSRSPRTGMIGPSTNAIGNEARVEVAYRTVDEMPEWAAAFVRENDGVTFAIPMLAMFCAVMRREVFEAVGPLDERFGVGMFEDDDYAHRLRAAGYDIVCARDAFVHHWMKASFGKLPDEDYRHLFETNRRLFEEKWNVTWTPHAGAFPGSDGLEPAPGAGDPVD